MREYVSWTGGTKPDEAFTDRFARTLVATGGCCMEAEIELEAEIECEGCPFWCEVRFGSMQWEDLALKKATDWLMNVKVRKILEE